MKEKNIKFILELIFIFIIPLCLLATCFKQEKVYDENNNEVGKYLTFDNIFVLSNENKTYWNYKYDIVEDGTTPTTDMYYQLEEFYTGNGLMFRMANGLYFHYYMVRPTYHSIDEQGGIANNTFSFTLNDNTEVTYKGIGKSQTDCLMVIVTQTANVNIPYLPLDDIYMLYPNCQTQQFLITNGWMFAGSKLVNIEDYAFIYNEYEDKIMEYVKLTSFSYQANLKFYDKGDGDIPIIENVTYESYTISNNVVNRLLNYLFDSLGITSNWILQFIVIYTLLWLIMWFIWHILYLPLDFICSKLLFNRVDK